MSWLQGHSVADIIRSTEKINNFELATFRREQTASTKLHKNA
jgi:hypothetical protein